MLECQTKYKKYMHLVEETEQTQVTIKDNNSRSESYSVLTTISHFSRKRTLKFLVCWFYISIHL